MNETTVTVTKYVIWGVLAFLTISLGTCAYVVIYTQDASNATETKRLEQEREVEQRAEKERMHKACVKRCDAVKSSCNGQCWMKCDSYATPQSNCEKQCDVQCNSDWLKCTADCQ